MNSKSKRRVRFQIAKIHLVLALVFGVPLVITALTGSILSFERELERGLNPGLYKVSPGETLAPKQLMLQQVQAQFPDTVFRLIRLPQSVDESVRFQSRGKVPIEIFVNPYTAEIIGSRTMDRSISAVARAIHVSFLAGKWGSRFSGLVSLLLILMLGSGLWLWWSSAVRQRKPLWRLRLGRSWFTANYDLHNLVGVVMAAPIFVVALTGAVFSFPELFRPMIYQLTFSSPPPPRPAEISVPEGAAAYDLDRLVALSDSVAPGTTATIIALPKEKSAPLRINRRAPGQAHHTGRHYTFLDPWREAVIEHRAPQDAPLGTRVIMTNRVLHTGELGGLPLRLGFFLASLSVILLFVGGLCHWWVPRRKQAKRRNQQPTQPHTSRYLHMTAEQEKANDSQFPQCHSHPHA